ncbi:MAG: HAD-IIA family hydrolase [Candidatus Cyclobacteriaceae bacterium M3_2C_046]
MISEIRGKKSFICDMDGVLYHGNKILPGVKEFVTWLKAREKKFLFLTNSSEKSRKELKDKMYRLGIEVEEDVFYTSALATAIFLSQQKPQGSAYVIGEPGLINALYEVGYTMNDINPDYVVMGETRTLNYEKMAHAINLVLNGAKLIGTNSDLTGPTENGIVPATKALIAPIELASGRNAYYVGKPNPLIMRTALKILGSEPEDTVIIGDRMDTDIIAGIESEIDTVLVLSGITKLSDLKQFPYVPRYILNGVVDLTGNEHERIGQNSEIL